MEEEINKMYQLKPGDQMRFYHYNVIRIPGGWAFSCDAGGHGVFGFFVPYDNDLWKRLNQYTK